MDELVESVRHLHELVLDVSTGLAGEHTEKLQAACARPFRSAFGEFIYPTSFSQAGALLHAIITSHAFVDGNKRTGVVAAVLYLGSKGELTGAPSGLQIALLGEVALATARSELDAEAVAHWLERILG